ncbi:MAG TPA: hypothetical protein VI072_09165 [Polyangiaceae bacterium]
MKRGACSLVDGANSLLFLRDALEKADEIWIDEFTSRVATLESAGLATGEQVNAMGVAYENVVQSELSELEAMISGKLPAEAAKEDELS